MNIHWQDEVEKRKEEFIANTQRFLQIPSVLDESTSSPDAPFGQEVASALNFVLNLAKENGMQTKNLDGYVGYAEFGEGEEMVGILCHVDVVPPGDGWSVPPFAAEIVDSKLIARGAMDDKGPTMAAFYAAKIVKELNLPLKRRIRLIFGADEESRWRCVDRYFAVEEMPTLGFAPDADFPLIHAEKGMYNVTFQFDAYVDQQAPVQLSRFQAGLRPNMVPDRAEVVLRGHDEGQLKKIGEQFQLLAAQQDRSGQYTVDDHTIHLTIDGVSAHGSTPEKGVHAGWLMVQFLRDVALDDSGSTFVHMLYDCFVDDPKGAKLGIATVDPEMGDLSVNVGVIHYDADHTARGTFIVNIRYPSSTNVKTIRTTLTKRLSHYHCQIAEEDASLTPHYIAKDHPLVTTLLNIYERHTGTKAEPLAIGGATYARSLNLGVAFGPLFPGREDTIHQKDEYILIEDLLKITAIYAEAIYELANVQLA